MAMDSEQLERVQIRVPSEWLEGVDHWRAKQDGVPSRDEAIRRLVEHALQAASASRAAQEHMDVWDADVARLHDREKAGTQM
jgi:metal-responsive CopG/Arc/MetJ family transcriptional regulator